MATPTPRPIIMCRIRPPLGLEERNVLADQEKDTVWVPPEEEYHFNKVFGERATHKDIFAEVQDRLSIFENDNTIMCYGNTGAGKTTTITGLVYLTVEMLPHDIGIEFNAFEVYNNKITHLVPTRSISQKDAGVYIRQAMNKRTTGSTLANSQSSRSHLFITFRFLQKNTVLTFIDLAGSERLIQTGDDPKRRQEAIEVNKSLSTLKDVVENLATKQNHVPWRNSTLTQQLRNVFRKQGGVLLLMLCVNHNIKQANETLKFGRKATKISKRKVMPLPPPPPPEEPVEIMTQESVIAMQLVEEYKTRYEETKKELDVVKGELALSRKRPRCGNCGQEGHNKRTCLALINRLDLTEFPTQTESVNE